MGWRDRPYAQREPEFGGGAMPRMRVRFGSGFTPVVMALMIANVAVMVIDALTSEKGESRIIPRFGLSWKTAVQGGQAWRFVTYMFLHADLWHIGGNMLGLYLFGPDLERKIGRKRFLGFYVACGLAGGAAYLAYGWVTLGAPAVPVIGASGAMLGVLIANAILFPQRKMLFLFFPMKVRTFALFYAAITILMMMVPRKPGDAVAHAAHFGGIVFAWVWFYLVPRHRRFRKDEGFADQSGAWERKQQREVAEQAEIDAILDKIHTSGLDSLTRREKRMLKDATRRQQDEEARRREQAKRTNM